MTQPPGTVENNPDAVNVSAVDSESHTVVKARKQTSDYFHTLAENEP